MSAATAHPAASSHARRLAGHNAANAPAGIPARNPSACTTTSPFGLVPTCTNKTADAPSVGSTHRAAARRARQSPSAFAANIPNAAITTPEAPSPTYGSTRIQPPAAFASAPAAIAPPSAVPGPYRPIASPISNPPNTPFIARCAMSACSHVAVHARHDSPRANAAESNTARAGARPPFAA